MASLDGSASFATLLQQYRAAAGLSQYELAQRAGLSRRGISDLERGERRSPHPATVRLLIHGLNLSSDQGAALLASARAPNPPPVAPSPAFQALPVQAASFVGRNREIAELRKLLGTSRCVTLTGPGGIGKTRLALQVACEYRQAVVFLEVDAAADMGALIRTVAMLSGAVEEDRLLPIEVLAASLRAYRFVLLMDGCESDPSDCAALASGLLMRCPDLTVLATSRVSLGIEGETVLELDSLDVPAVIGSPTLWGPPRLPKGQQGALAMEQLLGSDSVRLFVDRAAVAAPGFGLTQENASAVTQLCRLLSGVPLALELAAARVAELPVDHLTEQLSHALQSANAGSQKLPSHHHILSVTIDWSYKLLSDAERRLLERLAGGTYRGNTSKSVQCGDRADLEELIATSLMFAQPELGECKIGVPKPVREYITQRRKSTVL